MCCFLVPPHTTHLTQPLDKGCFGPLKAAWRDQCQQYITNNPGKVVTRYQFSRLFHNAWMQSMTMNNIVAGFWVTGVYPVDRTALRPKSSLPVKYDPSSLGRRTGLKYIPLYSPFKPSREAFAQVDLYRRGNGSFYSKI